MQNVISLVIFVSALSIGQIMFKQLGLSMQADKGIEAFLKLGLNPLFFVAVTLYAAATLLWIWILSRMPLSQAYPWVSAGAVIVPILSVIVFGEQTSPRFWLGITFVVGGLLLTQ